MAYQYDELGNVVGEYESDEERKKREELANQEVQTQQIKTYGDGSQEHVVKTQVPSAPPMQQARAMPIPTVAGPVSPESSDSFNKIRMIESGNRDYTPQGTPVTSSAGAKYATQVMPTTAQNPGYGLQPAASDTPEEYNRVGSEYFNAMKKKYGGSEDLAAAAYHSGPGNVDKALQQAQTTGKDWRTFLGPQGQNYVQKFAGNTSESTLPKFGEGVQVASTEPNMGLASLNPPTNQNQPAQPVSPYSLSTGQTGLGLQGPEGQMAPQPGQQPIIEQAKTPVQQAQEKFVNIQDNLDELMKFRADPNTPKFLQDRANEQIYEKLNETQKTKQAQQKIQSLVESGDNLGLSKILTSKPKDEEGSWAKLLLLGFISPTLAGAEADKLGLGPKKWEDATIQRENGTEIGVQLQRSRDGKILGGTYADGTPLSSDDIAAAQAGTLAKGVHVTKVETRLNPETNERVSVQTLSNGKERFMSGGKLFVGDKTKLVDEGDYTKQADRRVNAAYTNLGKLTNMPTPEQKFKALSDAGVPLSRIESELGYPAGTLSKTTPTATDKKAAQTVEKVQTTSQGESAYTEPTQRMGESNDAFKARLKNWEGKSKLLTKDAESFREKSTDVKTQLDRIREGIDILNRGEHNIGPMLGNLGGKEPGAGMLPGAQQFVGSLYGSQESQNTDLLKSLITRQGLEGIKNSMGPSISNFDVQSWMKSNPIREDSSPDAIKAYLNKLYTQLYNHAENAKKNASELGMIDPGFDLGPRPETLKESTVSDVRKKADAIIGK